MSNRTKIKILLKKIESNETTLDLEADLTLLEKEINVLLTDIKNCPTIDSAKKYFDALQEVQSIVSGLIFEKEVHVSDSMWKFFKDFDRIDDFVVRKYIYYGLKDGTYALSKGGFLWYR